MPTLTTAPPALLRELAAVLRQPAGPEPRVRQAAPPRDFFQDITKELLPQRFAGATIRAIQYVINAYSVGFHAAKAGNLHTAQAEFDRAATLFGQLRHGQSAAAAEFVECLVWPYEAYYHYRQGQFEAAIAKTQAAIASISRQEAVLPVFHLARIQQLHNLSRIRHRQGAVAASTYLVRELLRYLGPGEAPVLPGHWPAHLLPQAPAALRHEMLDQIFLEMVAHLLAQPDEALRRPLFAQAFGELATAEGAGAHWQPYQQWLATYEALLHGEPADYLPPLVAFVQQPGHATDLLKLALLLELRRGPLPLEQATLPALVADYARRTLWVAERHLALLD